MPDSRAAVFLFVASFQKQFASARLNYGERRSARAGSRKRVARVERLSSVRFELRDAVPAMSRSSIGTTAGTANRNRFADSIDRS